MATNAGNPQAAIDVVLDTKLADATLRDFENVMKGAFSRGASEGKKQIKSVEDSVTKLEKSFKRSFVNIEAGFRLAERAWRVFSKNIEKAVELSAKHEGRVGDLKEAYKGMLDAFGKAEASSGTFKGALEALTTAAKDFTKIFESESGKRHIDAFFDTIVIGAAGAIDAVLGLRKLFADFGKDVYEWAKVNPAFGIPATILEKLGIDPREALPEIGAGDEALSRLAESLRASVSRGVEGVDRPQGEKPPDKLYSGNLPGALGGFSLGGGFEPQSPFETDPLALLGVNEHQLEELTTALADREELRRLEAANQAKHNREMKKLAEQRARDQAESQAHQMDLLQNFAAASVNATKLGADLLVSALVDRKKRSAKETLGIIAEAMIAEGWAFQTQAIAYTFEAIATQGKTAYKAIAMGAAAKALLIGGYSLKAASGGGGSNFAGAPSVGSSGGGGGGAYGGGSGETYLGPRAPDQYGRNRDNAPVIYQVSFAGAIVGGDAKRIKQDLENILNNESGRPRSYR